MCFLLPRASQTRKNTALLTRPALKTRKNTALLTFFAASSLARKCWVANPRKRQLENAGSQMLENGSSFFCASVLSFTPLVCLLRNAMKITVAGLLSGAFVGTLGAFASHCSVRIHRHVCDALVKNGQYTFSHPSISHAVHMRAWLKDH